MAEDENQPEVASGESNDGAGVESTEEAAPPRSTTPEGDLTSDMEATNEPTAVASPDSDSPASETESNGTEQPLAAPLPPPPPLSPQPAALAEPKARREWTFRRWHVVAGLIAIALIAAGIGAASQKSTIDDLKSKNSALQSTDAKVTQQRDAAQTKVNDRAAQERADQAQAARIAAETKAAADKAAADKTAADAKAAASAAAAQAARTSMENGVYAIGRDRDPGQYQTAGPTGSNPVGCYYAVLNSTNTSDIATNNITQGPASIDLAAGQYFESSSCQTWQKVG